MTYYIHLRVKPYLANYVRSIFGHPVVLPKIAEEHRLLKELLRQQPPMVAPDFGADANLTIQIPSYEEKDVKVYHYLSEHGKRMLEASFYEMFWKNFFKELSSLDRMHCQIKDMVSEFMDKHDIPEDSYDMLIKRYYRWRKRWMQEYNVKM